LPTARSPIGDIRSAMIRMARAERPTHPMVIDR
jgi:hypothetical protein